MLLAAPVGATEVFSLATGIVTIYSPYFYPTLFYPLPLTPLSSHVFLVFTFGDGGYVFLIAKAFWNPRHSRGFSFYKKIEPRPYGLGSIFVSTANTFLTTKSVRICAFW